jgi:hypothetical protein
MHSTSGPRQRGLRLHVRGRLVAPPRITSTRSSTRACYALGRTLAFIFSSGNTNCVGTASRIDPSIAKEFARPVTAKLEHRKATARTRRRHQIDVT